MLFHTLEYSVNITFIFTGKPKKKIVLFALLRHSLYCDGLEKSQQYLQGLPVPVRSKTFIYFCTATYLTLLFYYLYSPDEMLRAQK